MRFIVAGWDIVARTAIETLLAGSSQYLAAVLAKKPLRTLPSALANYPDVPIHDVSLLQSQQNVATLQSFQADWLISAHNKVRIPAEVVALFPGRVINVHPGILPKYAGMYAWQWAMRQGESFTGTTVHFVNADIDTGDIICQAQVAILPEDTGWSVRQKVLKEGACLIRGVLTDLLAGKTLQSMPQNLRERTLYTPDMARDGRVDWRWTTRQVVDFIRAGNFEGHPTSSYTAHLDDVASYHIDLLAAAVDHSTTAAPGTVLRLTASGPVVACGDNGAIRILKATVAGDPMDASAWQVYLSRLPGQRLQGRMPTP